MGISETGDYTKDSGKNLEFLGIIYCLFIARRSFRQTRQNKQLFVYLTGA
jgi:hypothetical protein